MTRWPPATSVSLLAVATTLPALERRHDRPQADHATRRHEDEVNVVAHGQVFKSGRAGVARQDVG